MDELELRWMAQRQERDLALTRLCRQAALGLEPAGSGLLGRLWGVLTANRRHPAASHPAAVTRGEAYRRRPLVHDL